MTIGIWSFILQLSFGLISKLSPFPGFEMEKGFSLVVKHVFGYCKCRWDHTMVENVTWFWDGDRVVSIMWSVNVLVLDCVWLYSSWLPTSVGKFC